MTGRLEQALRLKSHGFFFLAGIGRGEPLRRQRGGAAPQGSGGAAPRLGAPSRARRGPLGTAFQVVENADFWGLFALS